MEKLALALTLGTVLAAGGIGRAEPPATEPTAKEQGTTSESHSVSVKAKVLYGTAEEERRADIELWISKIVAEAGSPIALPYTSWIELSEETKELYRSMRGGRIIRGRATEKDGGFQVEISGFKIKPLKQTVTLKVGERKVVKLTDYPAPRNVFIALEANAEQSRPPATDLPTTEDFGGWKKLYAAERWYKDYKQPEQVFMGTLQRHHEPSGASTLMRPHRYKLGERFLYPGKEHPGLEKLVGQQVEVRGKPYDVELEGQSVREIWPAAIRALSKQPALKVDKASVDPTTATLAQALEDWIVLLEADDVETAQQRWAKNSVATRGMKKWWATLKERHKRYNYRKWLDRAKQIGDAIQFKVGGHAYGHMHVDWEKTDQGWRIAKVWICR